MHIENQKLQETATQLAHMLSKLGATDSEIAISMDNSREVNLREGEVEKAESATSHSLAMRAYIGKRSASAQFSLDLERDYQPVLEDLIAATQATPEDPFCGLADADQLNSAISRDFDQFDSTALMGIDDLIVRARELEAAAAHQELVIDTAETSHVHYHGFYFASNGFARDVMRSYAGQGLVAIHQGESLVREYASDGKIYKSDLESVEDTATRARDRALAAKNPSRPASGRFPVLYDERVSSSLISHALAAMNGGAIARQSSWLIDYDETMFPMDWELVETPFRTRRLSSNDVDGEGLVKTEQSIIANGRPQFWISNLSIARQLDLPSSGHATRSGVNTGAGVTSAQLSARNEKRAALLNDMNEGLLVTGFIGATINPHTGDYSRGIHGFWVKNGEIKEAVHEATIAGNLKEILPNLRAADDADPDRSFVVPSLLVEEMTLAGN